MQNNFVKYFRRKSSLTHFPPTLDLLVSFKQVTPFSFNLKFSVEKLEIIELR